MIPTARARRPRWDDPARLPPLPAWAPASNRFEQARYLASLGITQGAPAAAQPDPLAHAQPSGTP
eukprot:gene4880-3802_t